MRHRPRTRPHARARDVNTTLQDRLLQRALLQDRYANAADQAVQGLLTQTLTGVLSLVHNAGLFTMERLPGTFGLLLPGKREALDRLMLQIAGQVGRFVQGSVQVLSRDLPALATLELYQLPRVVQDVLDAALPQKLREAEGDDDAAGALGTENLFARPTPLPLLFRSVPLGHITELLGTPLGGAFYATSFADLGAVLVAAIRNILLAGLVSGEGIAPVARKLQQVMGGARYKAERIVRSEFVRVANQAALTTYAQNADVIQAVQWVSTLDDATCLQCAQLDGRTWEAFTAAPLPVADTHPNCFVPSTRVEGAFLFATRLRYAGPVIDIETRQGLRLTVTPNHPILTVAGLRPAKFLREGDDVVSRQLGGTSEENEHVPPTIEQAFCAMRQYGFWQPARRGETDLHGDAAGGQGHIDIVAIDRVLLADGIALSAQYRRNPVLQSSPMQEAFHPASGLQHHRGSGARLPSYRVMRSGDLGPALPGRHLRPLEAFGSRPATDLYARLLEAASECVPTDADFVSQTLRGRPGCVTLDEVVKIQWRQFDGDVYDLQSTAGVIIANGIVASNCRCRLVPVVKDAESLGLPPGTRASFSGQVPETLTYPEWFRQQSADFKRKVLGPTRYKLYASGRARLKDFATASGIRPIRDVVRTLGEAEAATVEAPGISTGDYGDTCRWITKAGRRICITAGHAHRTPPPTSTALRQGFFPFATGAMPNNPADQERQAFLDNLRKEGIEAVGALWEDMKDKGGELEVPGDTWATLSDDAKSEIQQQWENDHYSEFLEKAEEEWRNDTAGLEIEHEIRTDTDWQREALSNALQNEAEFTPDQATEVLDRLEERALRNATVEFAVDDLVDEEQVGAEAAGRIEAHRKAIRDSLHSQYEDEYNTRLQNAEAPDSIKDDAIDAVSEAFNSLSVDELDQMASDYGSGGRSIDIAEPDRWIVDSRVADDLRGGETAYRTTGAIGKALVEARTKQLWADLGHHDDINLDSDHYWNAWKSDSYDPGALGLHAAAVTALGANTRGVEIEKALKYGRANPYESPNLEKTEVYVRALWDTTQFLMMKAGQADLTIYRAVTLANDKLAAATKVPVTLGSQPYRDEFVRLPDVPLQQNAAQSSTLKESVANSWGGISGSSPRDGSRVVVRARVPSTAVLSLPVYGQNVHDEAEAVILGTPWLKWDAWLKRAPLPERVAIEALVEALARPPRRRGTGLITQDGSRPDPQAPLIIDFADPDQVGNKHWLTHGVFEGRTQQEAGDDDCIWRTLPGRGPVCITQGHRHDDHRALAREVRGWRTSQPWRMSQDDIASGTVSWLSYDPTLTAEARYLGERKTIRLGPKFFTHPTDVRRAILYHEAGHAVSDAWLATRFAHYTGPFPDHLNGQTTPGEQIAEAYSVMMTEPGWLEARHPDLAQETRAAARAIGFPLPRHRVTQEAGDDCVWRTLPGRGPVCITSGHDEHGREGFHGTTATNVRAILREGLRASKSGTVHSEYSRTGQTYLTADPDDAVAWAAEAVRHQRQPIGVLEIVIPEEHVGRLRGDKNFPRIPGLPMPPERQFEGDIPAAWIKRAWISKPNPLTETAPYRTPSPLSKNASDYWLQVLREAAARGLRVYLVLVDPVIPATSQEAADDCTWRTLPGRGPVCITAGHGEHGREGLSRALGGTLPQASRFLTDHGWQYQSASPAAEKRHQRVVYHDPGSGETVTVFANGDWVHERGDGTSKQGKTLLGLKAHLVKEEILPSFRGRPPLSLPAGVMEAASEDCTWRTLPGRGPICITPGHGRHAEGAPIWNKPTEGQYIVRYGGRLYRIYFDQGSAQWRETRLLMKGGGTPVDFVGFSKEDVNRAITSGELDRKLARFDVSPEVWSGPFDFSNPGGPGLTGAHARETKIGDSTLIYGVGANQTAELISLRTPASKRGQGSAARALTQFLAATDARGLTVKLNASPLDKKTSRGRLIAFYQKHGFELTGETINPAGDPTMIRRPRAVAQEARDDCRWVTLKDGRRICIQDSHGRHQPTEAPPSIFPPTETWGKRSSATDRLEMANDIAARHGLPTHQVSVYEGDGPVRKFGDWEFREGGHFNPATMEIVLFADDHTQFQMMAMAEHEVGHYRWLTFQMEVSREQADFNTYVRAEGPDNPFVAAGVRAREQQFLVDPVATDYLKPEAKERWPALYARSRFYAALDAGKFTDNDVVLFGKSVSSYAKEWWERVEKGDVSMESAVNETLAEIKRRLATDWDGRWPRMIDVGNTTYMGVRVGAGRAYWEQLYSGVQAATLRRGARDRG